MSSAGLVPAARVSRMSIAAAIRAPGVKPLRRYCERSEAISFRLGPLRQEIAASPSGLLAMTWSSHILPVIRRFAGDRDVVDMAFAQTGAGDAHELAVLLHLSAGAVAGIAHRGCEAADQLVDDAAHRALVRHPAFDPFGHQL